jgi:hypothetical protein
MKDPKFYVGIVIGFSMSLVLLSIGFIVAPAYAPPTVGTDNILDNAITSPKIKDGEVKTQDLANGAVTKDKISPFALKLVVVQRQLNFDLPPYSQTGAAVQCSRGEVVTGGGFSAASGMPIHPFISKKYPTVVNYLFSIKSLMSPFF